MSEGGHVEVGKGLSLLGEEFMDNNLQKKIRRPFENDPKRFYEMLFSL